MDSIQHITNLTGGDTRDGYDTHAIRTRVDRGSEFSLRATHHWGSKDIGIKHTRLIHWLRQGGNIEMLLQWYGNGNARFSFSLQGSTNSINSSCPNFNEPPPPSTTLYVAAPLRVARRDSLRSVRKRCVRVGNFTINTVDRNIENWGGVQLR